MTRRFNLLLFILTGLATVAAAAAPNVTLHPSDERVLDGPDARQQLVLLSPERDLTREATFTAEPDGIVAITASGSVRPIASGSVTITAAFGDQKASTKVTVRQVERHPPVNFPNEIVPLFTKYGCNGGGCHGKSEGQNGFKLSLLGYVPLDDYGFIVREARGRRVFPAAPAHSLLIKKATGEYPHGGGARIEPGSYASKMLETWIRQGMPYGSEADPLVESITCHPPERLMQAETAQQLVVTAHYSDGTQRDISHVAHYESNQKEMAEVTPDGLVTVASQTGNAAIMIRFQEHVSVFQAIIPLGEDVGKLPPVRNLIDEHVFAKLTLLGLPPSPLADDATFLRRSTLDIAGRLPSSAETIAFLQSPELDQAKKRDAHLDGLLDSDGYADNFANKWSAIFRNKRNKNEYKHGTLTFHNWLRESIGDNKPYDEFASEILTASGSIDHAPPTVWYRQVRDAKAQLQDTAQIFLGVRLQCAECHHHPYEKWSEDDYYGFAAFFSRVGRKASSRPGEELVYHQRGTAAATNPRSKASLRPTPLDAETLQLPPNEDPRRHLAAWMSQPENEFFAPMLVNRYWKHFFGRGIVEPEDDIRTTNPATHPKLLRALSAEFVASGFDMKQLVRTITQSTTYQLSSFPNEHNATDRQNFSRYYPKRLPAETLLDAIDLVCDKPTKFDGLPTGTRAIQLPDDSYNSKHYFLTVFGRPEMDSACECERSTDANLAQCLHLLNSKGIQDKLAASDGTAAKLAKQTERDLEQKVRDLYHACFSREPLSDEVDIARSYLKGREGEKLAEGYQDIVWALINTKEFLFNH